MSPLSCLNLGLLVLALIPAGPVAQTKTFITPVSAATVEGSGSNNFPFTNTTPRRYIQIHSDLPKLPMRITAVGFRITATTGTFTGVRNIDMEMFMGRSAAYNACSFWMDNNWIGTRSKAVNRKTINFGPGVGANPGPSPFVPALKITLDTPFLRIPVDSFAWEIVVHSNTGGSIGTIDVDTCSSTNSPVTYNGTGCVATGQTSAMKQLVYCYDRCGTLLLMFSARYCPANAPAWLLLGTKNPNLPVPGLCTSIYSNFLNIIPIGTSDSAGDLNCQGSKYYYFAADGIMLVSNPGFGGTLYTQIMAIDQGRPGLPAALSDGAMFTLPLPDTTKPIQVTRLVNNLGGVTAKESACWTTSSVGYGLVMQIHYQ